jgi:hypothetical protein
LINRNPYIWAGFGLLVTGVVIFLPAYFVFHLNWLAALGICMLILAFILLALGRAIPRLPPEVSGLLLEAAIDNIAVLIEELGIKNRAIYLPSSLANGKPMAFIPLRSAGSPPAITRALPRRLIAHYGTSPEDIGLLVSTTGSIAANMLESKPGSTPAELESALTSLFTGRLGVADGVKVIHQDNFIKVEIDRPRLENHPSWAHQCLGGPLAMIVASVAAEAWNKPFTILREEYLNGKIDIELEMFA